MVAVSRFVSNSYMLFGHDTILYVDSTNRGSEEYTETECDLIVIKLALVPFYGDKWLFLHSIQFSAGIM